MKTNKSYSSRIRVTKRGKLLARKTGQNHFNAKNTGSERMAKRRNVSVIMNKRHQRRFLPGT